MKGVVYYALLKSNQTVAKRYQQLIELNRALKQKCLIIAQRKRKMILLHDNARSHIAKVIKDTLSALQWEVLPHAAYSPDYAPSDYHLFRSLRHGLADQHFETYEEIKKRFDEWIASKDERFFYRGIYLLKSEKKL